MMLMKRKSILWLLILVLSGCLIGFVFWAQGDSIGSTPIPAKGSATLADVTEPGNIALPEIDLRPPAKTEVALFALG